MGNKIETSTRNVKQTVRKFTMSDRQKMVDHIVGLPYGMKTKVLYDLNLKSLFYQWEIRYPELFKKSGDVKTTKPMNVKVTSKHPQTRNSSIHTVTLKVEVGSLMELIGFCNDIVKTPKVKSVLSVE